MTKIKIKLESLQQVISVLAHAVVLGYKLDGKDIPQLSISHNILLSPDKGIMKCHDTEYNSIKGYEDMSVKEFLNE